MVSKFAKIRCSGCKNEQTVFTRPSTQVNCNICNAPLLKPTGGKAEVKGQVIEMLE